MYDIEEIKSDIEGLSLQKQLEQLEEIQNEIQTEIDELESSWDEVDDLVCDIRTQIDENYNAEINSVLETIVSTYQPGTYSLLPYNTLDIEGLCCQFMRFSDNDEQLLVDFSGRKPIIRLNDFINAFTEIIKPLFPKYPIERLRLTFSLDDDTDVSQLVKEVAEKLISVAPSIAELAVQFRLV